MKIKKNDTVQIISGKDRGKTAKVLKVFSNTPSAHSGGGGRKILAEGIALRKKHQRPRRQGQKGEVVVLPSPIHASNAMLFCKTCGRGVRVGHRFLGDKKVRFCRRCKNEI